MDFGQRPIKFRLWDCKSKEYRSLDTIVFDNRGEEIRSVTSKDATTGHDPHDDLLGDVILEQWTGTNDKNGVPIYEGDVISDKNAYRKKYIGVVSWNEFDCKYVCEEVGTSGGWDFEDMRWDEIEVLGNVHKGVGKEIIELKRSENES